MVHRLLLIGLLYMPISSVMAVDYSPIETLMTESELKRSGIGQLTIKELETLNQWLQLQAATKLSEDPVLGAKNIAAPSLGKRLMTSLKKVAPGEKTKVVYLDRRSEDVISSRIVGDFSGWRGKTLFELDNGQIWRQRYSGYWKVKLAHPEVSITKNASGAYEMELVSEGKKMGVKRIR